MAQILWVQNILEKVKKDRNIKINDCKKVKRKKQKFGLQKGCGPNLEWYVKRPRPK
jgi:hypothetical protein